MTHYLMALTGISYACGPFFLHPSLQAGAEGPPWSPALLLAQQLDPPPSTHTGTGHRPGLGVGTLQACLLSQARHGGLTFLHGLPALLGSSDLVRQQVGRSEATQRLTFS